MKVCIKEQQVILTIYSSQSLLIYSSKTSSPSFFARLMTKFLWSRSGQFLPLVLVLGCNYPVHTHYTIELQTKVHEHFTITDSWEEPTRVFTF